MDPFGAFSHQLFQLLTNSNNPKSTILIKKHSEKLNDGDFSFPWPIDAWTRFLNLQNENRPFDNIFQVHYGNADKVQDYFDKLVKDTQDWDVKIKKCVMKDKRIHIFIDRLSAVNYTFHNLIIHNSECNEKCNVELTLDEGSLEDITYYRLKLCHDVLRRVFSFVESSKPNNETVNLIRKLHVSLKSKSTKSSDVFLVAPVLNINTGTKEVESTTSEYVKKRTLDMEQIALHKYGLRVIDKERWKESISNIGEAAVIFDLLENKPTHSVSLDATGCIFGSSKGAAFVMYNYARLRNILKRYNENMKNDSSLSLPAVDKIDFSQLKDEDEWILIFNFILPYYSTVLRCVENTSNISPHHLCIFLSALATRFSIYYRRIRILLKSKEHLLPLIHARIYLLMKIQEIFELFFYLLSIKSVSQM